MARVSGPIQSAALEPGAVRFRFTNCNGQPAGGLGVLFEFEDGRWERHETDADGTIVFVGESRVSMVEMLDPWVQVEEVAPKRE